MATQVEQSAHPIIPVIMAGGQGKRLWPLSRLGYPKQFQALNGNRSPFLESVLRLRSWIPQAERPIIVTSQQHLQIVKQQLELIQVKPLAIVLEPESRKTAPATLAAALVAERMMPGSVLLVSPSDQIIRDRERVAAGLHAAARAALAGDLVVFGLTDSDNHNDASYLATAGEARADGLLRLSHFIEGSQVDAAESSDPGMLMNSGIYCFTAEGLLAEAGRLESDLLSGCRAALDLGEASDGVFRLDARAFAKLPARSLGDALLGRSGRAMVTPLEMRWDDLGSWNTLWNLGLRDSHDNVSVGDSHVLDCNGVYARSEGPLTAVYGVDDLVVVATPDAVLVARRDDRAGIKKIHDHLAASGRRDVLGNRQRREEWGWVETIEQAPGYALRRIVVHPGCSLPVERHHHHGETLTVVSGLASLWLDGAVTMLRPNESANIPLRALHSVSNPGRQRLELIEVQSGSVIGDDDRIVLDEDAMQRIKPPAQRPARIEDSEARALLTVGPITPSVCRGKGNACLDGGLGI